jgi:hypothetical protein
MGQTMTAPAFCYHPAGSLHGIRAIGDRPARYLVIEMHGERARADWSMADEFTATPGRSWTAPELDPPARVQAKWNHFADEDSRQINMSE